jgi:methyltransferase (TIGR00027 family)
VRFVPVDFERDDLEEALRRAGFDPQARSVVLWEGVPSYLTERSVERAFAELARLCAPGSTLLCRVPPSDRQGRRVAPAAGQRNEARAIAHSGSPRGTWVKRRSPRTTRSASPRRG